jgi:hypothetical protein
MDICVREEMRARMQNEKSNIKNKTRKKDASMTIICHELRNMINSTPPLWSKY